jgi:hypothetical protein
MVATLATLVGIGAVAATAEVANPKKDTIKPRSS